MCPIHSGEAETDVLWLGEIEKEKDPSSTHA
jgi:hypothetical protein